MNTQTLQFNNYNPCDLSHNDWNNDINKHNAKYMQLKDNEVISSHDIEFLINNNYNIWLTIINDNPYFNKECYLVELFLTYINKPITCYISKEYINNYIQPSLYWYEYTLRGFSPSCQPKGHIEVYENKGRYGHIAYDRPLTQSELYDYDLKEVKAI